MRQPIDNPTDEKRFFRFLILFFIACIAAYVLYIAVDHVIRKFDPASRVATIFGEPISYQDYDQVRGYVLIQSRLRYGQLFEQFRPLINIEDETWETLLLAREARRRDIRIGNDEVIEIISKMPIFIRKNGFDRVVYRHAVREFFDAEPGEFEEAIRLQLIIERLFEEAVPESKPSPEQLQAFAAKQNRQAKIHFAKIAMPADTPEPSEEELRAFFETHARDYWMGPSVKVDYIRLDFPEDGGVQKEVENKYKAIGIYNDHIKKPDFYALGEKYKYPAQESDFFTREEPDPAVDIPPDQLEAVFNLKRDELTTPIERPNGYLVVKMKSKRSAGVKDFKNVQADVVNAWKREKGRQIARDQAKSLETQIRETVKTADDWNRLITEANLSPNSTELIASKQIVRQLSLTPETATKFLTLPTTASTLPALETSEGYVTGFIESWAEPELISDEETSALAEQWTQTRRAQDIREFLEDVKDRAQLTITLTQ